jgi:thiol-disulfide isomerase/thioredoxin
MRMTILIAVLAGLVSATAQTNSTSNETHVLKPSPSFTLHTLDDAEVSSTNFAGKTRIVLFWASWDEPSRKQLPVLVELQREYGSQGLQVLGLALDNRDVNAIKAEVLKHGVRFPVLLADYDVVKGFGGVDAIPTLFLIAPNGTIVSRYVGLTQKKALEPTLRAILHAESPQ